LHLDTKACSKLLRPGSLTQGLTTALKGISTFAVLDIVPLHAFPFDDYLCSLAFVIGGDDNIHHMKSRNNCDNVGWSPVNRIFMADRIIFGLKIAQMDLLCEEAVTTHLNALSILNRGPVSVNSNPMKIPIFRSAPLPRENLVHSLARASSSIRQLKIHEIVGTLLQRMYFPCENGQWRR
jgi:hypothetical protein